MQNFTPVSGFAGGLLIGLGAAVLAISNGRIAGISGILGGLLGASARDMAWRLVFLLGLLLGPWLLWLLSGRAPTISAPHGSILLIVGGLLVGYGTRLGNGCTSGHGVCGLARGSRRSLVATAVFFGTAILVALLAQALGWHTA
ncbi:MAG: YeeE/YedE family protein [Gammaproteobacteria bacterium]|nr:YeeE/YedE family protein [Gammaproteobacteria bacterium]